MAPFYSLKLATKVGSSSQQAKLSDSSEFESKSLATRLSPSIKVEEDYGIEFIEVTAALVKQEDAEGNVVASAVKVEERTEVEAIQRAIEPRTPSPPPRRPVAPRFYSKVPISIIALPKNGIRFCYRHYWNEAIYRYPVAAAAKNGIRFYRLNSRMARTLIRHSPAPVALRRSLRIQQRSARK